MLFNLSLIALSGWLLLAIPKGFIPEEDTGIVFGYTQASPDVSFMGMSELQQRAAAVVKRDPDVLTVGSAIGGNASSGDNTGRYITLKPWNERNETEAQVIERLRPKLAEVPGIKTFLQPLKPSASALG